MRGLLGNLEPWQSELHKSNELQPLHGESGLKLAAVCAGNIFPCDALCYAGLERSLNTCKGFSTLMNAGGYTCAVALLRMQLDTVLRLNGVILSGDPHGVAGEIIHGERLEKLKDSSGQKMRDVRLVELLAAQNPWVTHVYGLASGYIHLSQQHVLHFLERAKKTGVGHTRDLAIGNADDYLDATYKLDLVKAFKVVTSGVLEVVNQWTIVRPKFGDAKVLSARFTSPL